MDDDQMRVPAVTGIHLRSGGYGTHVAERMPQPAIRM
jgi:hypothetical protein